MYRVPAAPELDKHLRRAIWLALFCCSFASGLLLAVLMDLPIRYEGLISLGVYLGLLRACWIFSARTSLAGLHTLVGISLALILGCLAMPAWSLFGFRYLMPWVWYLIMPVTATGLVPNFIGWFLRRAAQEPAQG